MSSLPILDSAPRALAVLLVPGWQVSGLQDWPMPWARVHGYTVLEQNDWRTPLRGDWLARLDEAVIDAPAPLVLVAHGLGCILVAAWAALSKHTHRVRAAFLVAPVDTESPALRERLPGWSPVPMQSLPFKGQLLYRQHDPLCDAERALEMAKHWAVPSSELDAAGDTTANHPLGDWPQGHALLQTFLKD